MRGGSAASEAEDLLEKALEARGAEAVPDGALADVAAWLLRRAYQKEDLSAPQLGQRAAARFGFAGEFHGWLSASLDTDADKIKDLVEQVPKNSVINRYGIVGGQGNDVSIAIGGAQVTVDDFPRSVAPGGALRLKGEVSPRFERASVFVTSPDGKVRELARKDRAIDTSVTFAGQGIHQLEVMGYGTTGPVVLLNVPIHVGVAADELELSGAEADPNLTAEDAEATALALLNEERAKHGLGAVAADAELRAVALAHSVDMATNHFVGHVSPTTGTPEQRVAKAELSFTKVGECIALDATPAGAHRGLLDSPAHRAAMLDREFSHVGVGIAFDDTSPGQRRLLVTLLFGRRPPPGDKELSPEQLVELVQGLRKAWKLPALRADPVLMTAASAGARALSSGAAKSAEQAMDVARRELQKGVDRSGASRSSCLSYFEMNDRIQLSQVALLRKPDMRAIGVGVVSVRTESGDKLGVFVFADPGPGKVLKAC